MKCGSVESAFPLEKKCFRWKEHNQHETFMSPCSAQRSISSRNVVNVLLAQTFIHAERGKASSQISLGRF